MRKGKTFQYSIAAGWLVTTLAAALVATILVPEESRSVYFWHRVCWTEFLIFLFWCSTGLYLLASGKTKDHVTRFGGIAPTISIVTAIYVVLSFAVMMIHSFVPETDAGNRIHLIAQIVLLAVAALCLVFLSMARAGATAGLDFDKSNAMTPRQLHDLLALHESSLPVEGESVRGLKASIKQLREALLYSLNESESLAQSTEYQSVSNKVQELCDSIEGQQNTNEDVCDRYATMTQTVMQLIAKAKFISANQDRM